MKSNKVKWMVVTIATLTIVIITIIRLDQVEAHYQKNLTLIEKCVENNGALEVVVKGKGIFSSSTVHCE